MIKFIIVDDDDTYINIYEDVINKVLFNSEREYGIFKFNKYTSELKKIIEDNSEQKIYIMDLELEPKHPGIEILKEIRNEDWDSEILVVTSHDRMFERIHKEIYKTFDFIEKFDELEKRLEKDIKKIVKKKYDIGKFCYNNRKISIQIYYKDIIYIYRDTVDRTLVIKTTNNEFYVNMTINEVLQKLDNRFQQCHRGCIINNERIQEKNYCKGYFITDGSEKVDLLSRNYKEEKK